MSGLTNNNYYLLIVDGKILNFQIEPSKDIWRHLCITVFNSS